MRRVAVSALPEDLDGGRLEEILSGDGTKTVEQPTHNADYDPAKDTGLISVSGT